MAGKKSPWGEPGKGSSQGDGPQGDGQPPADGVKPEAPKPDAPKPDGPKPDGPRNPWVPPTVEGPEAPPRRSASIEDIFKARARKGSGGPGGGPGGGGGFPRLPQRPDGKSWLPLGIGLFALVWLGVSTTHFVAPQEEGVVTTFGSYSRTLEPGVSMTLPWPIENVKIKDVTTINVETIPDGEGEQLMLTADQNLVDLSYIVRWNIKDLKLYTFQLSDPDQTVRDVAEAAMRQALAEVTLDGAMGNGRAAIETNVRERSQRTLDFYKAGIAIQGVEIKKTDPPAKVVDAFKKVLAAQQEAQGAINSAQGWAQQLTARAQGEAAAFDRVYEQYKLAPIVTKRRMYYETMERVLSKTDKVIVETPNVTSYLPLPQINARPPAPPEAPPAAAATPGAR